MDTQGRVVRTDTFSKFLAPGFRLGLVAAPPLLHEKMARASAMVYSPFVLICRVV